MGLGKGLALSAIDVARVTESGVETSARGPCGGENLTRLLGLPGGEDG
jgi:hypothetical protein